MKWQFMLSLKYLFEKRRERFISVTTLISIMGIAVGVAALIVTMGIMNGFNSEIEEKILNVNPHIIIAGAGPMEQSDELIEDLMNIEGVEKIAEFLDGQALVGFKGRVMGVLLRGISSDPDRRLIKMDHYLTSGVLDLNGDGVLIGSELARSFGIKPGDNISLISPLSGKRDDFKINGIFNSGRYDYDLNLVFVNMEAARKILGSQGVTGGIGLKVDKVFEVEKIKKKIYKLVRPSYRVMTWKDIDRNLFSALKLEKIVMFLVVALIIFVACFNIISTLIMTVMEKTKDIGILKAIGATRLGIMSVFLLEGLYISIIGIGIGAALGLGICYLQSEYELVKLPPDIYYIYSVPIRVSAQDTLLIIAAAFMLGLMAAVYPSIHASRLRPVEALRC